MAKGTVNKVIILGRLGQDPDVRQTASGTAVANLNVATNELGPKDQSGQRAEVTEWHRVVLFGKTAELAQQYLNKGSLVYLEGRLQTRKWTDQNGNDRYSTEVVANDMQFVGGNGGSGAPQQPQQGQQQQGGKLSQPPVSQQAQQPAADNWDDGDSIPF